MTPAVRHGLQAGIIGCALLAGAALWIAVLAFTDRAAIAGWPVVVLLLGVAVMLGGVAWTEVFARRRP